MSNTENRPLCSGIQLPKGLRIGFVEIIKYPIGSVMVAWDNGCGLNVVLDEDEIEIIPAESNH